jgi:coenzyme PQQ precursor peptide PqqA
LIASLDRIELRVSGYTRGSLAPTAWQLRTRAQSGRPAETRIYACAIVKQLPARYSFERHAMLEEETMTWTTPTVEEVCVGMEVTSYESAEI